MAGSVDVDVLIAGGGPAGAATGISLAEIAPSLRVALVDRPRTDPFRIGESAPPPIIDMLERLGLARQFRAGPHAIALRTLTAWESEAAASNEFLFHARSIGWRLDRAAFDAMLVAEAARRGVTLMAGTARAVRREDGVWRIGCDSEEITARFLVDATGAAAAISRRYGIESRSRDRLVAFAALFDGAGESDVMVEARPEGWWYTARIPCGRRVVALMTDSDLLRSLDPATALAGARFVKAVVGSARPCAPAHIWPAGSRLAAGDFPPGFLSVGDAIARFDPISSQGVVKALRSGMLASYAIADWCVKGDKSGVARYVALMRREFSSYLETLGHHYGALRRWPAAPFWRRRHALMSLRSGT